jgi:hypothetical protein
LVLTALEKEQYRLNTAEALEAITDRGKFERLATSVLRKANKNYDAIIQTGINAQGETIKSPVDGFCLVPGSTPPHFIIVGHTTTEADSLESKWLYENNGAQKNKKEKSVGDLIKAGRLAEKIRLEHPEAEFTVILTSNQHLNADLPQKIYKKAKELKVTCDIWEQSRLSDFLDTNPEGHWLRKACLSIEAEMLSESLLLELSKQSLKLYEHELFTNINSCVLREEDKQIEDKIQNNKCTIQFLIGESGYGKSVVAYKTLEKHIMSGGCGFWIPAEFFEDCMSLENVIEKTLRNLSPSLLTGEGKKVPQLIKQDARIFIVVDDINGTQNPAKLVRKLLVLSAPEKIDPSNSDSITSPYLFICPLWPQIGVSINDELSRKPWITTHFIGAMNALEGKTAIQLAASQLGVTVSDIEATTLSTEMGHDPFIIGLFLSLITFDLANNLHELAGNVIDKFIISTTESAKIPNATYLSDEYRNVLTCISCHMLLKKKLHPSWNEIIEWFGKDSNDLKTLRELIQHGKLCRLTEQGKFIFRHDRVQESLLVKSAILMLTKDFTSASGILGEPFYAEIIGKALLNILQNNDLLTASKNNNILALFKSIQYFGMPVSDYHRAIIEKVKEWVAENVESENMLDYRVFDAICWSLVETDSAAILDITDKFPKWPLILLARLRNGDAFSGVLYCADPHHYVPGMGDVWRDKVIEKGIQNHRDLLQNGLKQLLISPNVTVNEKIGALVFAGFLGFSELRDDIADSWTTLTDKLDALSEAIWAVSRCCGDNPEYYLNPLVEYWVSLSDEEKPIGSQKLNISEELRFSMKRGINNNVIRYFISRCDLYESLRWPITIMLQHVNDPDAIEFIVRSAANIQRSIAGTDKFSPWVATLTNNWDGSLGKKLSESSLFRLKILWKSESNDEFIRKQAFRLWLTGIDSKQIDILRSISNSSPFFHSIIWKRVELGDRSVVPVLLPFLQTETHWFNIIYHVWCDELVEFIENYLKAFKNNIPKDFSGGRLNAHYNLSKLLMMIPAKDAELMLTKCWGHLGYSRLFIQTALYIGTPKCLEFASSAISQCPATIPIFEHLGSQFGFLESGRQERIEIRHLNSIVPYLDRLDEFELWECAEVCQRKGFIEWSSRYLSGRLNEQHRKHFHPSDDDLVQELNKLVSDKHGEWRVQFWIEEFNKRHDSNRRILNILNRWLPANNNIVNFKIVAACLSLIGTRSDLSLLDKYTIVGS